MNTILGVVLVLMVGGCLPFALRWYLDRRRERLVREEYDRRLREQHERERRTVLRVLDGWKERDR